MQARSELDAELEQYQSDLQVRFALHNGQVETAESQPLTNQSDMLLLDRFVIAALRKQHCQGMLGSWESPKTAFYAHSTCITPAAAAVLHKPTSYAEKQAVQLALCQFGCMLPRQLSAASACVCLSCTSKQYCMICSCRNHCCKYHM